MNDSSHPASTAFDPRLVADVLRGLRRRGHEAQWVPTEDGGPLVRVDGGELHLDNLQSTVRAAKPWQRGRLVRRFLHGVLPRQEDDLDAMSDVELAARARSRVMPAGGPWAYARPLAGDLVHTLSFDLPGKVSTVMDGSPVLRRDLDALYAAGLANLRKERVRGVEQISPGLWALEDDSLFVASQILDIERVREACAAPGMPLVVGLPSRNTLLVGPMRDLGAVEAIGLLANIVRNASEDVPGGIVSREVYFLDGDVVQVVSEASEDGGTRMLGEGAFLERLNALAD